jgi:hypothetical protein
VISVVCVYDDREILEACLLQGLKRQTADCDLILVDNTESRFKSAAQALNYGGEKARGKYVVFAHQDMVLGSEPSLNEIAKTLDQLPDLGIAGAAGCAEGAHRTLSNISHGTPPRPAGTAGTVTAPIRVQTLDECLAIVARDTFGKMKFDEEVCDGWHLYAVDYSLSVQMLGLYAYVIPVAAYHKSTGGRLHVDYYRALKRVLRKHRDHYGRISTTCGIWDTRNPLLLQRFTKWAKNVAGTLRDRQNAPTLIIAPR